MQDHEIIKYLDGIEITKDQFDRICTAALTVEERYPIPEDGEPEDVAEDRAEAFSAAVSTILGRTDPRQSAQRWREAQHRAHVAHAQMTGAIIGSGMNQSEAARELGLTRMTVRKAFGK